MDPGALRLQHHVPFYVRELARHGSIEQYRSWLASIRKACEHPVYSRYQDGDSGLCLAACFVCGHWWKELPLNTPTHHTRGREQHSDDWSHYLERVGGTCWMVVYRWKPHSFHRTRELARATIRALKPTVQLPVIVDPQEYGGEPPPALAARSPTR